MLPVLFKIGPLEIRTYGLMLAIAFLAGIYLSAKRASKRGENPDNIYIFSYYLIISSLIGARLFYVLFHLDEFAGRWIYTFWPVQEDGSIGIGGLMILGGVIFGFITGIIYFKVKKLDFFLYSDIIAPTIPLGIFFGRLGCFFNGCCFGKECNLPWGVSFPQNSPAGSVMGHKLIHPTQLYESLFNLLLFFVILVIEKKIPSLQKMKGSLFSIFLIGYGIERFIVDFYRYYESQMFIVPGLDFNQLVSLGMIITGIAIIFYSKKQLYRTNN